MRISPVTKVTNNKDYETMSGSNVSETFAEILKKKQESNTDAKEFLSKLDSKELYELQKVNHLANNINVQALSEEGAENLFLSPIDQYKTVDLNNDGIVEVGAAKMVIFPPPNAPENVKAAWKETSKTMTPEQKMRIQFQFVVEQIQKNTYMKPDGTWGTHNPNDAGWVNIFGKSEASIIGLCNDIISRIDNPLESQTSEQTKKSAVVKSNLLKFINLIEINKVS